MHALFRRNPRLITEVQAGTAGASGRFHIENNTTLVYRETIEHQGVQYHLRFVYPIEFPHAAIAVFLDAPALPVSRTVHRYSDTSLCLFDPAYEWHPSNTIVWIRARAVAWIRSLAEFSRTGRWPEVRWRGR